MVFRLQLTTVRDKGRTFLKLTIAVAGPGEGQKKAETVDLYKLDLYGTALDRRGLVFGYKDDVLAALDRVKRKAGPVVRKKPPPPPSPSWPHPLSSPCSATTRS
jgi:hypothetical protein